MLFISAHQYEPTICGEPCLRDGVIFLLLLFGQKAKGTKSFLRLCTGSIQILYRWSPRSLALVEGSECFFYIRLSLRWSEENLCL